MLWLAICGLFISEPQPGCQSSQGTHRLAGSTLSGQVSGKLFFMWENSRLTLGQACCGETAALHLLGNQTRHLYSSSEHPPNRVRAPTLFKVTREATKWGAKNSGMEVLEPGLQVQLSHFLTLKLGLHFLYPDGPSVTSQCWHSLTGSSSWSQLYNMTSLHDHLLCC